MGLFRPGWISNLPKGKQIIGGEGNRAGRLASLLIYIAVIAAVAFAGYKYFYKEKKVNYTPEGARSSLINDYKNKNNLNDKRSLISAYSENGNYKDALNVAQQVAAQTKTYQDYMTVLAICTLHEVPNKTACLNDIVSKLKPLVNKMPFYSAYSAGLLLEKNDYKQDALVFYQRAYDVYQSGIGGEAMMSKKQLKKHIDELRI